MEKNKSSNEAVMTKIDIKDGSKIKEKIRKAKNKIVVGTLLTAAVVSGGVKVTKNKIDKEDVKKEWIAEHAGADSVYVDNDTFYAEYKPNAEQQERKAELMKELSGLVDVYDNTVKEIDAERSQQNKKLLAAAQRADLDGIKKALACGADINAQNNKGQTALMLVLQGSSVNYFVAAKYMVDELKPDYSKEDKDGAKAIDYASTHGNTKWASIARKIEEKVAQESENQQPSDGKMFSLYEALNSTKLDIAKKYVECVMLGDGKVIDKITEEVKGPFIDYIGPFIDIDVKVDRSRLDAEKKALLQRSKDGTKADSIAQANQAKVQERVSSEVSVEDWFVKGFASKANFRTVCGQIKNGKLNLKEAFYSEDVTVHLRVSSSDPRYYDDQTVKKIIDEVSTKRLR